MNTMVITLIRSTEVDPTLVPRILKFLNKARGPLRFRHHAIALDIGEAPVHWETLFERMEAFRQQYGIPEDHMLILLTDKPNDRNWFSSPDMEGKPLAFLHTGDWEYYMNCNRIYPLAYEVMSLPIYQALIAKFGAERFLETAHQHPIGCISDMCGWKVDITLKMRTADICSDCRELIRKTDLPEQWEGQTLNLFEKVRKEVLLTPRKEEREDDPEALPYPVAVTKRKLASSKDPLRMLLFLIDHFDSLIRMTVILGSHKAFSGPDEIKTFFLQQELNDRPTLGRWVGALKALSKLTDARGNPFFTSAEDTDFDEVIRIAERAEIVEMRNTQRGHGYIYLRDDNYRDKVTYYLPIISEIEQKLRPFLVSYSYFLVKTIERYAPGTERLNVEDLAGASDIFHTETLEISTKGISVEPLTNRIYAVSRETNEWIDLHPHMTKEDCPKCKEDRVLLIDGQKYLDVRAGHQVTLRHT